MLLWAGLLACFLPVVLLQAASDAYSAKAPDRVVKAAKERFHQIYREAKARFQGAPKDSAAAWQLGRACFDCADLAEENAQRSQFSLEGIEACKAALAQDPKLAAAYYYMGLNQGQLARTRKLSALGILQDIQASWTQAIALDPQYDFAGPHRSIGILYRDAPGWPLSLGNRAKAREHLKKAVELAAEYPDNQISWLESLLDWGERPDVRAQLSQVEKVLEQARKKLTGDRWKLSWHDWDHRWEVIQKKAGVQTISSPRQAN